MAKRYHISSNSLVLQFSYLSFDSSLIEIWATLLSGGTLVIPGNKLRSDLYGTLRVLLTEKKITNVAIPPSVLLHCEPKDLKALNTLIVVGEACPVSTANKFFQSVDHFINGYGPTEAIICAATFEVKKRLTNIVPIGLPLPEVKIKLFDPESGKESDSGQGEIYIASDFLAEGYPLDPKLTEKSFVVMGSERFYKTGDIARVLPDGNYVFLGRTDNQVKVNGQRLELESVESMIEKYAGVEKAIAVLTKDKHLAVAYQSKIELSPGEIKEKLTDHLQPYAVPSIYKWYSSLPVDRNGKADRREIKCKLDKLKTKPSAIASHTDGGIQEAIIKCWEEVLGNPGNIEPKTDFFSAGGDSLLALALLAELNGYFNLKLHVTDIFLANTNPRGMSKVITSKLGVKGNG